MLAARRYRWSDLPDQQVNALVSRKVLAGEKGMLALFTLKRGGVVALHHHPQEQLSYVLQGRLRFTLHGREEIIGPGEILHLPSDVEHGAEALDDTLALDVFVPVREEWLKG